MEKYKTYTYVSVVYDDDFVANIIDEPSYYYKTDIKDIKIGDKVLVDRQGREVIGKVVDIEKCLDYDTPYSPDKIKDIIEVIR